MEGVVEAEKRLPGQPVYLTGVARNVAKPLVSYIDKALVTVAPVHQKSRC